MKLFRHQMKAGQWFGLGVLFVACCPLTFANLVNVDVQPTAFSPSDVTIHANDQVQWTWVSSPHSSTSGSPGSPTGLWDSGIHNSGFLFTNTFTTAGYFPYYCVVHGFTGTVTVEAANVVTNVDIEPSSFSPSDITINLNDTVQWTWVSEPHSTTSGPVFDPSGLWDSGVQDTGFVFTFAFTTAGAFPYYCSVHGFTGSVTVVAPAPSLLSAPQFIPPSTFQFSYSANAGQNYVVQRSRDLNLWTPLATNTASSSPVLFQDTQAPAGSSFYRVLQLFGP